MGVLEFWIGYTCWLTLVGLFKLLQFLQPSQHHIFTCLFNLACQENLVEDRVNLEEKLGVESTGRFEITHLVKVEHEV